MTDADKYPVVPSGVLEYYEPVPGVFIPIDMPVDETMRRLFPGRAWDDSGVLSSGMKMGKNLRGEYTS